MLSCTKNYIYGKLLLLITVESLCTITNVVVLVLRRHWRVKPTLLVALLIGTNSELRKRCGLQDLQTTSRDPAAFNTRLAINRTRAPSEYVREVELRHFIYLRFIHLEFLGIVSSDLE